MIKYPNGKAPVNNNRPHPKSASNRGMTLEHDLDVSNKYYLANGVANIHKKPTPIQIVKVDYPARNKAKITEAYYKTPSTTDYNGIYKGYYIDFEAKETKSKTLFKLANVHAHQVTHLKSIIKHGGVAFFIIKFHFFNEIYLVKANLIIKAYEQEIKSISYQTIKEQGYLIPLGYNPRIDYLKGVDALLNQEV